MRCLPVRLASLVCGLALSLAAAGCGASHGTPAAGGASGSRSGAFAANPAIQATAEIMQIQPVVPFSQAQVAKLVPMLQKLAQNPNPGSAQLTADATAMEAVFTPTQQEALKNLQASARASGTARFSGARRRLASGTARRSPSGSAAFRGRSGSGSRTGAGPGGFSPSAIYTQAIAVLQGKASAPQFVFGGGPRPAGGGAPAAGGTVVTRGGGQG